MKKTRGGVSWQEERKKGYDDGQAVTGVVEGEAEQNEPPVSFCQLRQGGMPLSMGVYTLAFGCRRYMHMGVLLLSSSLTGPLLVSPEFRPQHTRISL